MPDEPLVLGIETSCDETGIGIVRGTTLLADAVASSVDEHARFGGVVPEVASRAHLEAMVPTVHRALETAGVAVGDVDAVAVTAGPGLAGALLVGVAAAKAYSLALGVPLYGVNHLAAHVAVDVLELVDRHVRGQVVDPVERLVQGQRERLRAGQPHDQGAHQPGAGGHGDGVHIGQLHPRDVEGPPHRGHHRLQVRPARDLGHDPAESGVLVDAGRDGVGQQCVAPDQAHAGLVAGCLDPEHERLVGHPSALLMAAANRADAAAPCAPS